MKYESEPTSQPSEQGITPGAVGMSAWLEIRCACVHPDAETCAMWRSGVEPDDPYYERKRWQCECMCHREAYYDDEHF